MSKGVGKTTLDQVRAFLLLSNGTNSLNWENNFKNVLDTSKLSTACAATFYGELPANIPDSLAFPYRTSPPGEGTHAIVMFMIETAMKPTSGFLGSHRGKRKSVATAPGNSASAAGSAADADKSATPPVGGKVEDTALEYPYGWYEGDPFVEPRPMVPFPVLQTVNESEVRFWTEMKVVSSLLDQSMDATLANQVRMNEVYAEARKCGRADVMLRVIKMITSAGGQGSSFKMLEFSVQINLDLSDLHRIKFRDQMSLEEYLLEFDQKVERIWAQGFDPDRTTFISGLFGVALMISLQEVFSEQFTRESRLGNLSAPKCTLPWAMEKAREWGAFRGTTEDQAARMAATGSATGGRVAHTPGTAQKGGGKGKGAGSGGKGPGKDTKKGAQAKGGEGKKPELSKRNCDFCGSTEHWTTQCDDPRATDAIRAAFRKVRAEGIKAGKSKK
jgi:hypothetical protein